MYETHTHIPNLTSSTTRAALSTSTSAIAMAARLPVRPLFLPSKPQWAPRLPARHVAPVRAFGRPDLDAFARRVTSGEALRDAWRGANEGAERLAFEARRAADRLDRRFSLSRRLDAATRAAADRARELDRDLGLARRWRSLTVDLSRNWPMYKRDLDGFLVTPLGKGFVTVFFLWFALSGWMFRFFFLATWVLPFAAPLLIGTFATNFVIEGACPACKRQFVGYRNQVIRCTGCRNIVWQPGDDFKGGRGSNRPPKSKASEQDIIDIEIDEK